MHVFPRPDRSNIRCLRSAGLSGRCSDPPGRCRAHRKLHFLVPRSIHHRETFILLYKMGETRRAQRQLNASTRTEIVRDQLRVTQVEQKLLKNSNFPNVNFRSNYSTHSAGWSFLKPNPGLVFDRRIFDSALYHRRVNLLTRISILRNLYFHSGLGALRCRATGWWVQELFLSSLTDDWFIGEKIENSQLQHCQAGSTVFSFCPKDQRPLWESW